MADPATHKIGYTANPIAWSRKTSFPEISNLPLEGGAGSLIRIQREYPVEPGTIDGEIFLFDEAGPVTVQYHISVFSADLKGSVRAAAVHDHDLIGPGDRPEGVLDIALFIEGNQSCRDRFHGWT